MTAMPFVEVGSIQPEDRMQVISEVTLGILSRVVLPYLMLECDDCLHVFPR